MARFKLDTNMPGAFLNLYQPIGDDPVVRSLEGDSDLYEYYVYRHKEIETEQEQFIYIDDMCHDVDKYLTKHFYQNEHLRNGESREGQDNV